MLISQQLLDILRSPASNERLRLEADGLVSASGLRYEIIKGIPCLVAATTQNGNEAISSRDYYDQLAQEYQGQDDFWNNPYDAEIWRLEHDLLKGRLIVSGPMLDVACGFYPHFKFTYGQSVIAGDISFESLLVAREFGDESKSVQLVQFDATALPFADQSFGNVLAGGELLNHIPNYPIALSEFWRVLKPGGILLLQVGSKWCFDSLWATVDPFIGHVAGYSVTKKEAFSFFRSPTKDVRVTWGITPTGDFQVALIFVPKLKRALNQIGFKILDRYGANCISGIIPLPVQQESKSRLLESVISALIRVDRLVGRFPVFRSFAGNIFLVCQRPT
jgi:ubiquinone/menaquinone biosynthesis C-methylase UbiE/uncharacterized protein YbaR (Trm112 family)